MHAKVSHAARQVWRQCSQDMAQPPIREGASVPSLVGLDSEVMPLPWSYEWKRREKRLFIEFSSQAPREAWRVVERSEAERCSRGVLAQGRLQPCRIGRRTVTAKVPSGI
jgi:hypothetical protein